MADDVVSWLVAEQTEATRDLRGYRLADLRERFRGMLMEVR